MESKLVCMSLLEYLQELPPLTLLQLYQHSAACLAVLRELPELSRQYATRLVFLDHPLSLAAVNSWPQLNQRSQSLHRSALSTLQSLKVVEQVGVAGRQEGVLLNQAFKSNIKCLLCGGGTPWLLPGSGDGKHARDVSFLDNYANTQWENILKYMVNDVCEDITRDTVEVLQRAQLMASSVPGAQPEITTRGFQFLLLDRSSQVWLFILQYLAQVESQGMNMVECLTLIFKLSFLTLGKDYSIDGLTPSQLQLLQHLRQFGMAYQRKRSSRRFYPTKLIINLVTGNETTQSISNPKDGFVVLETNFRIMAYTSSSLQVAILGQFAQLQYRFPNLVVGTITRDSVHKALMKGITAEQILSFLKLHAHPEMHVNHPLIPPTVSDQVHLWERERDRLDISEGVLYSEFLSATDFETVRNYAEDLGVLQWSSLGKRVMVVSQSGHDEVKRFWRRQATR
ncbi:general transcription factor IIH subunit 4-like [Halichondria panicea]|uniref:general transcription factor IIH subunit 4-like n=1 Tax=Halichondria panicea TaxID=6063 RepID=UPI00312B7E68